LLGKLRSQVGDFGAASNSRRIHPLELGRKAGWFISTPSMTPSLSVLMRSTGRHHGPKCA
jgi:hypothetical protein